MPYQCLPVQQQLETFLPRPVAPVEVIGQPEPVVFVEATYQLPGPAGQVYPEERENRHLLNTAAAVSIQLVRQDIVADCTHGTYVIPAISDNVQHPGFQVRPEDNYIVIADDDIFFWVDLTQAPVNVSWKSVVLVKENEGYPRKSFFCLFQK